MSDENFGFGINFSTNAKQTAQDLRELDKAQKEVEKTAEKNRSKSKKSDKRQSSFREELLTELRTMRELQEKLNRVREKGDKQREKSDKQEIEAGRIKLGQQKRFANGLTKAAAAAYTMYKVVHWSMSGLSEISSYEHGAIASLAPGMTPGKLGGIVYATKEYGGSIGTASSNTARLQTILNQRRMFGELGFDEMLAGRFPGLSKVFTDNNGKVLSDTTKVMRNLNRFLQGKQYADQAAILSGLGISPDWIPLLTKSPAAYDSAIASNTASAASDVANAEAAAKSQAEVEKAKTWWSSIKTDLFNWLTNEGKNIPMVKTLVAIETILPTIATSLTALAGIRFFSNLGTAATGIGTGAAGTAGAAGAAGLRFLTKLGAKAAGTFSAGTFATGAGAKVIGGTIAFAPAVLAHLYLIARGLGEQERQRKEYLAGFDLSGSKPTPDNIPGFTNVNDIKTKSDTRESVRIYEGNVGARISHPEALDFNRGDLDNAITMARGAVYRTGIEISSPITVNIDAPGGDAAAIEAAGQAAAIAIEEHISAAFQTIDRENSTPWVN